MGNVNTFGNLINNMTERPPRTDKEYNNLRRYKDLRECVVVNELKLNVNYHMFIMMKELRKWLKERNIDRT